MIEVKRSIRKNRGSIRQLSFEAALSELARRRWPHNTIENVKAEWGLTHGRAHNVVYGKASLDSLRQIAQHASGGWGALLEITEAVTGQSLADFLNSEIEGLTHASLAAAREAENLARVEARLRDRALGALGHNGGPDFHHRVARGAP